MAIKQEESTPEQKAASYKEARSRVIAARECNNGSIPNNWGQAKEEERYCRDYVKDKKNAENAKVQDKARKDYLRGNDKSYTITKRNRDEDDDI